MNPELLTYKTLPDKQTAEDFAKVLEEKGITVIIEEDSKGFDASFTNNPIEKDYRLKIKAEDFPLADLAYKEYYQSIIKDLPKDYYLFEFDTAELQNIINNPFEWGELDFILAKQLLKERGIEISTKEIERIKEEKLTDLSKPSSNKGIFIILGYLCSFIYPILGIAIGAMWRYSKKTLPNGIVIYSYDSKSKFHGKVILILGLIFTIIKVFLIVLVHFPFTTFLYPDYFRY
jgi:hypothetical protein